MSQDPINKFDQRLFEKNYKLLLKEESEQPNHRSRLKF